jgi:hypothetical protein
VWLRSHSRKKSLTGPKEVKPFYCEGLDPNPGTGAPDTAEAKGHHSALARGSVGEPAPSSLHC